MGKMLGGDEEKDPDAAKKEEERQEALRQEEEERKAKYAKMEAEREAMRQGIRDKVWTAGRGGGAHAGTTPPHCRSRFLAWARGTGDPAGCGPREAPWQGPRGTSFFPFSLLGSTAQTFGWSLQGVTAPQVSISATQAVPGLECPPWSPQSFLFLTEGGWSSTHGLGATLGPMPGWASPVEGTWPESLGPNGRFGSGEALLCLGPPGRQPDALSSGF